MTTGGAPQGGGGRKKILVKYYARHYIDAHVVKTEPGGSIPSMDVFINARAGVEMRVVARKTWEDLDAGHTLVFRVSALPNPPSTKPPPAFLDLRLHFSLVGPPGVQNPGPRHCDLQIATDETQWTGGGYQGQSLWFRNEMQRNYIYTGTFAPGERITAYIHPQNYYDSGWTERFVENTYWKLDRIELLSTSKVQIDGNVDIPLMSNFSNPQLRVTSPKWYPDLNVIIDPKMKQDDFKNTATQIVQRCFDGQWKVGLDANPGSLTFTGNTNLGDVLEFRRPEDERTWIKLLPVIGLMETGLGYFKARRDADQLFSKILGDPVREAGRARKAALDALKMQDRVLFEAGQLQAALDAYQLPPDPTPTELANVENIRRRIEALVNPARSFAIALTRDQEALDTLLSNGGEGFAIKASIGSELELPVAAVGVPFVGTLAVELILEVTLAGQLNMRMVKDSSNTTYLQYLTTYNFARWNIHPPPSYDRWKMEWVDTTLQATGTVGLKAGGALGNTITGGVGLAAGCAGNATATWNSSSIDKVTVQVQLDVLFLEGEAGLFGVQFEGKIRIITILLPGKEYDFNGFQGIAERWNTSGWGIYVCGYQLVGG